MEEWLSRNVFWRVGVFRIMYAVCILFFVLTIVAMFIYPGGVSTNPHSRGYDFFLNFFSDLGRITTPSGQSNLFSRVLFTIALSLGGLGVGLLFVALMQFFPGSGLVPWLSRLAAIFGVATGVCFVGVALVPQDLNGLVHDIFIDVALVLFLCAFLLLFVAILRTPGFPRRVIVVFSAFGVLLVVYSLLQVYLLLFGPRAGTSAWVVIQATGQKIIVYAAILTAFLQALSMQPLLLKKGKGM